MVAQSCTPVLSEKQILKRLHQHYGAIGTLSDLPSYLDLNKKFNSDDGRQLVVKIANYQQNPNELHFEIAVMSQLGQQTELQLQIPHVIESIEGEQLVEVSDDLNRVCSMRLISFLEGELWANVDCSALPYAASLGSALARVDRELAKIQHPASHRYLAWDIRHANTIVRQHRLCIKDADGLALVNKVLLRYEAQVLPLFAELPQQIIHNDANDYNLLVDTNSQQVTGLIDFGDMVSSFRIAELAIAAAYAVMGHGEPKKVIQQMVVEYHKILPLQACEIDALLNMMRIRLAVSICMSSHQYQQSPDNKYLLVSQQQAWMTLKQLEQIDSIAFGIQLKRENAIELSGNEISFQTNLLYRQQHLSENLSLAYQQPLKIVGGRGAYLYDDNGGRYLDMVNNVCHVGHCHPQVVLAGQKQMATLNTNTRYLHDNIIEFSRKLLATMPAELSVCMLVNSGSEANELALRLARTHTNRKAMIVVEGAYHGNTNGCIDISPYKFDGMGGSGSPDWVKQTLVADTFRGKFVGNNATSGFNYGLDVKRAIDEFELQQQPICGFICESIQGVGGQIVHPPGYLKAAYAHVRAAGGVCIADEVQVGMGRVGSHWWAFQTQGVVPDILTIGKPLGNGHPLAAVVTTQAIAKSFVNGMEYFNTFGGNPVSCAIGSAVIDVIESQQLMKHALQTGELLIQGLKQLQQQYPIIGDVRGLGMFIGAEFIKHPQTLEPAVEQIDYVIERLKQQGVLLTTEGPLHNVLKIKPPLPFSKQDGEYFLEQLSDILQEPGAQI